MPQHREHFVGPRVSLVDCDFDRPTVHRTLDVKNDTFSGRPVYNDAAKRPGPR